MENFLTFFTDPILRGPTLGCMLMCLSASLIGVVVFLQKRSLLGEALSHASYPGIALGVLLLSSMPPTDSYFVLFTIFGLAFVSSLAALFLIRYLENRLKMSSDAALCFTLASFFGVGILLLSFLQAEAPLWLSYSQTFLYGQAATMTDGHIYLYGALCLILTVSIVLLFYPLQMMLFDRGYAASRALPAHWIDFLLSVLLVFAIVVGMRSVGVVLMSGMLIAPPLTARLVTRTLSRMWVLSGVIGLLSGFFGSYLSYEIPLLLSEQGSFAKGERLFSLPTGPMVLLVASFFCIVALLFGYPNGLVQRGIRMSRFRYNCFIENFLKFFWKRRAHGIGKEAMLSLSDIQKSFDLPRVFVSLLIWRMQEEGWIVKNKKAASFYLTQDGWIKAERMVRLHRLWEVYLVTYLGQNKDKVHQSAEQIEHILTPSLEKELSELLGDPVEDPHAQPIPHAWRPENWVPQEGAALHSLGVDPLVEKKESQEESQVGGSV